MSLIENMMSKQSKELELEAKCEFELESEDFNLDQMSSLLWIEHQALFH